MKVQNKKLAGSVITLRYSTTQDRRPVQVRGDSKGVFDVPEDDGKFLLNTQGWSRPKVKKDLGDGSPVDPRAAGRLKPAKPPSGEGEPPAPTPAAPKPAAPIVDDPPAPAGGSEGGEGDDGEDVDAILERIEGLRTRAAGLEMVEEYRAQGYELPDFDEESLLKDMKDALLDALVETPGDEGGEDGDA